MVHSLAQQLVRQDPVYYCVYVALRSDKRTSLVSYPYYTKFQHPGDSTAFRHIDLNINDLAGFGRGAFQIQGTVSLDDEEDDDYLEILPSMHRHLEEWNDRLKARGVYLRGAVHAITERCFDSCDWAKFQKDWTPVPCRALQCLHRVQPVWHQEHHYCQTLLKSFLHLLGCDGSILGESIHIEHIVKKSDVTPLSHGGGRFRKSGNGCKRMVIVQRG